MNKKPLQFRTAVREDLPILVDHNLRMAMETEKRALDRSTVEAGVKGMLEDPRKGFYLLAEVDGQMAGSLMITFEWSDWQNGLFWWFTSVFIRPEFRKSGVFKGMYQDVMKLAKAAGGIELRLYVDQENLAAQKVYEALGMMPSHYLMYEVPVP